MNALIGYTGFVGSSLLRQTSFPLVYRSKDLYKIKEQALNTVVCAAAPAQKWIANREPVADRENIERLIGHLRTVTCDTFILISTIDVFRNPVDVDEGAPVYDTDLHPYGLHRRLLEQFVEEQFSNHLIIRLPGLVGPGLRKNIIFDFLNDNKVDVVDSRGLFQFYPMVNLWYDIETALRGGLRLVHLTAEPISVAEVSEQGFGRPFENHIANRPAQYDMRTVHAAVFGVEGQYQYSRRESIQAIRAYAQSEPRTLVVPNSANQ